jgi:hypothetical protein
MLNNWKYLENANREVSIYISINQQAIVNTSDDKQKTLL